LILYHFAFFIPFNKKYRKRGFYLPTRGRLGYCHYVTVIGGYSAGGSSAGGSSAGGSSAGGSSAGGGGSLTVISRLAVTT
jgi:hypothetical protein